MQSFKVYIQYIQYILVVSCSENRNHSWEVWNILWDPVSPCFRSDSRKQPLTDSTGRCVCIRWWRPEGEPHDLLLHSDSGGIGFSAAAHCPLLCGNPQGVAHQPSSKDTHSGFYIVTIRSRFKRVIGFTGITTFFSLGGSKYFLRLKRPWFKNSSVDPFVQEYRKVQSAHAEEGSSTYTFLQWEAKKFPYIFDSWGGDKINDSWQAMAVCCTGPALRGVPDSFPHFDLSLPNGIQCGTLIGWGRLW